MQAIVLAAGKGKRLLPLTANRSKAMIPVAGVPIVARVIEDILTAGIREFIIVVGPEDERIRPYIQHRFADRAAFRFVVQQQPLGMGHALQEACEFIRPPFLLTACDNLVERQELAGFIQRFRSRTNLAGLLSLLHVDPKRVSHTAIVSMKGDRIVGIVEKPQTTPDPHPVASTPLYIFSESITGHLACIRPSPRGEYELQDAISALIAAGAYVEGFFLSARKTLTTPEDLRRLTIDYLQAAQRDGALPAPPVFPQVHIAPPVLIEPGVVVGPGCVIGPNAYLETGVHVPGGTRIRDDFRLNIP